MAQCYHKLGKYQEAITQFNLAIDAEVEKGNKYPVNFLKNFAQCHFDNGQYEDSIKQL